MGNVKIDFIKGGEFLLKVKDPQNIFTPEDYTEQQLLVRQTSKDFLNKEIYPIKEVFDCKEGTEIAPSKLEKLADLDFFGLSVPEKFGGLGLDYKTDLANVEIISDSFGFAQSVGIQKGLGVYTILFYGSPEQKEKYLPGIISARTKCSYCLTEPEAGSDPASARTKAVYSEDKKHFILNGQKMWITNAGFADVFSVFCKIEDDENLSCLIVEKDWGVKLGEEENKLGIRGSSTRQVFFENVKVPVENLLGERNKGFKIAMNALNMGRLMIGVAGTGISKRAFRLGVQYANQRVQFKQPIATFGAIQEKIAKMATKIYALETSWNRLAHEIDICAEAYLEQGLEVLEAKQKAMAEFAVECSMIKVFGSEVEDFVVDESLQIHGGMGFSGESDISVLYRNIRGNRIYEGTNEINRLFIPTTILKKAMKGELPLMPAVMQTFQDLQNGSLQPVRTEDNLFELAFNFLSNCKKVAILVSGLAAQKFMQNIKDEQEVLSHLSNIMTQIYMMEGMVLRTIKCRDKPGNEVKEKMLEVFMHETSDVLLVATKEVIYAAEKADKALQTYKAIKRLCQLPVINLKDKRRFIAQYFIERNDYIFN